MGSRILEHVHVQADGSVERSDAVVVEEPLEIRMGDRSIAVTMRTPGHDPELTLGFLVTEGIIRDPAAVLGVSHCIGNPNVVEVRTEPGAEGIRLPETRHFYASSSCGLCGQASIEDTSGLVVVAKLRQASLVDAVKLALDGEHA